MPKYTCLNKLDTVLADRGVSGRWLAEQLGVTDMTVSRWKTNRIQPSMTQFVQIARILRADIRTLIDADFNYEIDYAYPMEKADKQ